MINGENGLVPPGGYVEDGTSGGGGGAAGRIRINTASPTSLILDTAAVISPSNQVNLCLGACTRGALATW